MQANAHACHTLIVSCAGPQKSTGDVKAQQQIGCNLCVYVSCVCVNAEELGQRTRVDREAQHQMSSILQAGEEDAQRRIEDGYREASQAVSTAL